MSVFKCKMCGGTLEVNPGETVGTCEYCGTKQTLPKANDEVIMNLFNRANNLRLKGEFDKASQIYEKIVQQDDSDAEAHWGIILCKYGVEYVEDPKTFERIPTCHRTCFESIKSDPDYQAVIDYSDTLQQTIYEKEARAIDKLQKDILAIVEKEEPFDVFICYKETDESGKRTIDSTLANDIYHQLTQNGLKVFYAAITLEDKLGQEYEPYIFAALNSAKVMLAIGTKPEHFNAVWVKNEWSRFMSFMKTDRSKILIPCYRDMDAYDLPEEFAHLQAQDMSKIGFIQDIIRGVEKVVGKDNGKQVQPQVSVNAVGASNDALLKRAFMALEDGEWDNADDFCEQVLNQDPENAKAYLGKLMAELKVKTQEDLRDCEQSFDENRNYIKALRFSDNDLANALNESISHIKKRNEDKRLQDIYDDAKAMLDYEESQSEDELRHAAQLFNSISGFKDADALAKVCLKEAQKAKNELDAIIGALMAGSDKIAKTTEEAIEEEKQKEIWLKNILKNYKEINKSVEDNRDTISNIEAQIYSLSAKRANLGVFAGRERKAIDNEINELYEQKKAKALEIDKLNLQLKEYTSESQIKEDLADIKGKQAELEEKLLQEQKSGAIQYSYEQAKERYKCEPNIAIRVNKINPMIPLIISDIGDVVTFGKYHHNSIEWCVLEKEDGKMLLISKYALDCMQYNNLYDSEEEDITWGHCSLRKWMNGEFINSAFTEKEREVISTATVKAYRSQSLKYRVAPESDTKDKVFLLSIEEANKYFKSNYARQCKPTTYAKERGIYVEENGNCWWWLRARGRFNAAGVSYDGSANCYQNNIVTSAGGVRPSMWINLEK